MLTGWNNSIRTEASWYIILLSCKNLRVRFVQTYHCSNIRAVAWFAKSLSSTEADLKERRCSWSFKGKETKGCSSVSFHHLLGAVAECLLVLLGMEAGSDALIQVCTGRGGGKAGNCICIQWTPVQCSNCCHFLGSSCCFRKSLYYVEENNASKHPHWNK